MKVQNSLGFPLLDKDQTFFTRLSPSTSTFHLYIETILAPKSSQLIKSSRMIVDYLDRDRVINFPATDLDPPEVQEGSSVDVATRKVVGSR